MKDYHEAKENFDTLQATVGDKMTVTVDEFDEIFSLICQDPSEHFELFDSWGLGKVRTCVVSISDGYFVYWSACLRLLAWDGGEH